jgi:hypothetical protein
MMKALSKLSLTALASASLFASSIGPAVADVLGFTETGLAWTHTASSCAVAPQQGGKAFSSGADFSFLPNAFSDSIRVLGRIIYLPLAARCNVLNPLDADPQFKNPVWNALIVGYQDPDGRGTGTSVSATLTEVSRNTGSISWTATFNSNDSNVTQRTEDLVQFGHLFDFRHNEYYIELGLIRTPSSPKRPLIYSVRLTFVNGPIR